MSGRGRGNSCDLDNHELPPTQAASQAKTLFSLTGGFVPISGPFGRVAVQPERRTHAYASLNASLPCPAFRTGPKTYAAWPVWSDSTTKEIRFQPMPKKAATRLWHRARDFDRQTRRKDHHGGAVGHAALQVLHALIFDFLNYRSGRLDPSYAAIARKANVCERTVANALKRLRELGILNWVRRCAESWQRRALRAGAGDERLCRAAGDAVARLQAAAGAASAACRAHGATTLPCPRCSTQAAAERREGGDHADGDRHPRQRSGRRAGGGAGAARPGDAGGKSSVIYRTARHAEKHSPELIIS